MDFDFDPDKDAINQRKHGLSLKDFCGFDDQPIVLPDDRFNYGETRYRGYGRIRGVPHAIAFTIRSRRLRLISFRRAREKELRRYE